MSSYLSIRRIKLVLKKKQLPTFTVISVNFSNSSLEKSLRPLILSRSIPLVSLPKPLKYWTALTALDFILPLNFNTTRISISTTTAAARASFINNEINPNQTYYFPTKKLLVFSNSASFFIDFSLFVLLDILFTPFIHQQQRQMSSSSSSSPPTKNSYHIIKNGIMNSKNNINDNYNNNNNNNNHDNSAILNDQFNDNADMLFNVHSSFPITNGHYSLDHIRQLLLQCDPNCNGRLQLKLDDQTGVGLLCINSPQRKNAFSGFMMAQFSDVLDQLEQWTKGQVVIIYGADNFFCSGADLKTIRQNNLSDQCGAYFISAMMHSNLTRLEQLPLVSVAMIEGKALGGGAEVITACDFRVAVPDAQIGFVHARLGVTPGFGGGTRLLRLLGRTAALDLMLSARLIDAAQAKNLGLVQHILDVGLKGEEALKATIEWYRNNYGVISSFASQGIKRIVATGLRNIPTNQALEMEAKIFCSVWGSEEHKKALASNIKHHK